MRTACLVLAIIGALPSAICTLCSMLGTAGSQTGEEAVAGTFVLALYGAQFVLGLGGGISVFSKTGKGQKGTMGAIALVLCFILSIVSLNWLATLFFLLAAIFGFIAKPVVADTGAAAAAPMQEPPTT